MRSDRATDEGGPGLQQNTKHRATGRSTVNGDIGVLALRSGPQRRKQTAAGHQLIPSSKGKHTTHTVGQETASRVPVI